MDAADLVGYIVGERDDDSYIYACIEHTPEDNQESHRQVLRDEAETEGATCVECDVELAYEEGE